MICKCYSADICGTDAYEICVEADVAPGLPGFMVVGLPSSEVREARERVERAIVNSGFDFPARRITINLSPAYLRKQGSGFDLPIAVAILASCGKISQDALKGKIFSGELSLDGSINPVRGILPVAIFARENGYEGIVVPQGNAFEGAAVQGILVHGAKDLRSLADELNSGKKFDVEHSDIDDEIGNAYLNEDVDFRDVVGQESAKKATVVAAAGFHNLLYIGPPGAGKSMMARRIPTIFSRLTRDECLEISKIYSVAGLLKDQKLMLTRPFRAPHQSITDPALLGGSGNPRPGEITLAHKGVLFLDELNEFRRSTINELRGPLEDRKIMISRMNAQVEFPCDFILVAATNPCFCGYYPDRRFCRCSESDVRRYLDKIRGPVTDRIDICVGISRIDVSGFGGGQSGMSSEEMRSRVLSAQQIQAKRFAGSGISFNSQMNKAQTDEFCGLDSECRKVLEQAYERFNMTARGWYKVLKVARTIADLEGSERIRRPHILESITYRNTILNSGQI